MSNKSFFTLEEMQLARTMKPKALAKEYKRTERALKREARAGANPVRMKRIMDTHQKFEYALLAREQIKGRTKKSNGGKRK